MTAMIILKTIAAMNMISGTLRFLDEMNAADDKNASRPIILTAFVGNDECTIEKNEAITEMNRTVSII